MDNKINNNPMEVSIMSERKYPVITISREFGAGGHSIARVVSERLGIPYYDRDFAKQAAARSGYSQEDIDREGENLSRSARLLDNILNNSAGYFSSHDAIYQAQKELILQSQQNRTVLLSAAVPILSCETPVFPVWIFSFMQM
jgi:cytidylate kinase